MLMFTGLVEARARCQVHDDGTGRQLRIAAPTMAPELAIGESVAVTVPV